MVLYPALAALRLPYRAKLCQMGAAHPLSYLKQSLRRGHVTPSSHFLAQARFPVQSRCGRREVEGDRCARASSLRFGHQAATGSALNPNLLPTSLAWKATSVKISGSPRTGYLPANAGYEYLRPDPANEFLRRHQSGASFAALLSCRATSADTTLTARKRRLSALDFYLHTLSSGIPHPLFQIIAVCES